PFPAHPQATDPSYRVDPIEVGVSAEGIRHRSLLSDPLRARGSVVPLDPDARIYDLGICQNAKIFWSKPTFPPRSSPGTLREPPKINPDIIRRINEAAT
ncbi:hypothetical protein RSAG8_06533, partial [Rhizoctonia solani AG-8 WAC10335]